MFFEPLVDVVADCAERWVIRRRVARYLKKASVFGRAERFQGEVNRRIDAAKPAPVDFSAIADAYVKAMEGVSAEPMIRLVKGKRSDEDRNVPK